VTTQLDQIAQRVASPARLGQGTAVEQSRAVAEVHGAIVVAQQVPRDITRAVADMHRSCAQRSLAEKAFFRYSRGGSQISGPSVQLARELARCFGNMQFGLVELRRDDTYGQSEMQAWAWDVQTNTRSSTTFIVQHVRDTQSGTKTLTDQRDIYENNANNGARRLREMIFAILPGWYTEDAVQACYETLAGGEENLADRITKAIKGFGDMGIQPGQLEQKLGAPQSKWTPYDLAQLTVVYRSLARGEVRKEDEFPATRLTAADITAQAGAAPNGNGHAQAPVPDQPPPLAEDAPPPAGDETPPAAEAPAPDAGPVLNDKHGSITPDQQKQLWAVLSGKHGFTRDDRAQSRQACEQIIGRKLTGGTTGNLSEKEASYLIGTLDAMSGRSELVQRLAEGGPRAGSDEQ